MIALSSFRIYLLDVIKTAKLLNPRNVACSSKQLFFPYQTVFFKNDNWRVNGVEVSGISNTDAAMCQFVNHVSF